MNTKKAFLMGGLIIAVATGAFGQSMPYEQIGKPQGTCNSIPSDLCTYQGPVGEITENDSYDQATHVFTMVRQYGEGQGFKATESIPINGPKHWNPIKPINWNPIKPINVNGPKHWTPTSCYVIDPSTLAPIGTNCGPNDSVVKVKQAGVYNNDGTITITEHGELLLRKKVNPQFPEGGSMVYTVKVTYVPSK